MRLPFLVSPLVLAFALTACPSSPPPDTTAREVVLLPYPDDGGAVTWSTWAGGFTRDYCVECHNPTAPCGGNGCHSAGDARLFDLRDQAAFVANKDSIKCGIAAVQDPAWSCGSMAPKTFPKNTDDGNNPLPTDEQRAIMVDWINQGCP